MKARLSSPGSGRSSKQKIDRKLFDIRHGIPERVEFAGVRLTSPGKIYFPDKEITKWELASYYHDASAWMLPHVANRPLVLVRCPEGRVGACFYQKHPPPGTPPQLKRIPIRESSATKTYLLLNDVSGLVALAQIGVLEIHVWGSRADKVERADRLIFDLDPDPELPWSRVVEAALQMRKVLRSLGLTSFVKTTGGKGLHVVAPIERRHSWDEVKDFCRRVAEHVAQSDPAQFTSSMAKTQRTGRIFLDYLRNARGATAVCAYSPRARPGAPVSVPLSWRELNSVPASGAFHLGNIMKRLRSLREDPWKDLKAVRQNLSRAREILGM